MSKSVRFNSLAEVANVVDTLSSLLSYPKKFKEFPPEYLELIRTNMRTSSCITHLHPGLSCTGYFKYKWLKQFKNAV